MIIADCVPEQKRLVNNGLQPFPSPAHSSAEPVNSGLSASPLIIVPISPEDTQGEGLLDKDQLHTVIPTPDRRGNGSL